MNNTPFKPISALDPLAVTLILPAADAVYNSEVAKHLPNEEIVATEAGVEWLDTLNAGGAILTNRNVFLDRIREDQENWAQNIESPRGLLGPSKPKMDYQNSPVLSGDLAITRFREAFFGGGQVDIPLWHSGFWITLRAPTDDELIEVHRAIAMEKVVLGRNTQGAVYSNNSVYLAHAVVKLVMANVVNTSLRNREDVLARIKQTDLQVLAWGLATAMFPSGFQYRRAVLPDMPENLNDGTDAPNGITHIKPKIIEALLNIGKCLRVYRPALSERQRAHMSQRSYNSMSDESVTAYQEEFTFNTKRICLDEARETYVTFKVPTIDNYINAGTAWVDRIVDMLDTSITDVATPRERNQYIYQHVKAVIISQFAHFVETIEIGPSLIKDAASVTRLLGEMSAVPEVRAVFNDEIKKFIEEATIAIVAVPSISKADEAEELTNFDSWIPIDALSTFFTLLGQKVMLIDTRWSTKT